MITTEELVKKLAEYVGRVHTNATASRFSGLPPWYVVDAIDLMDELHKLSGISEDQIGQWFNEAAEAADEADKRLRDAK